MRQVTLKRNESFVGFWRIARKIHCGASDPDRWNILNGCSWSCCYVNFVRTLKCRATVWGPMGKMSRVCIETCQSFRGPKLGRRPGLIRRGCPEVIRTKKKFVHASRESVTKIPVCPRRDPPFTSRDLRNYQFYHRDLELSRIK